MIRQCIVLLTLLVILGSSTSADEALDTSAANEQVKMIAEKIAAEQGNAPAQVLLGSSYDTGSGVTQDHALAAQRQRSSHTSNQLVGEQVLWGYDKWESTHTNTTD